MTIFTERLNKMCFYNFFIKNVLQEYKKSKDQGLET